MPGKLPEGMNSEEDVRGRLESIVVLELFIKPVSKGKLF